MSAVALEPRAVFELLATKVERYLTSGQPEDVLRIEMAEAVTEAWMVLRPNDPPPWRFDVPEVPAHVTALRSEQPHGRMWFRTAAPKDGEGLPGSWWIPVRRRKHDPGPVMHITDLATYAPLVECEDPRVTP